MIPSDSAFIDRHREIADLETVLEEALSGHGRLVMLAGQPGIGKTRTAQELAARAEQRGAKTLWRLTETINAHTEGNPFFMREVIGQRLNRLSDQCTRTLTVASVIGRRFGLDLLQRLTEDESPLEVLEEAVWARVLRELVHYSLLAGEQALAAYAWEEALAYFERGLEAKEGQVIDADKAALLFGLGRSQRATLELYRLHEVVNTVRPAFDYYVEVGDVPRALPIAGYEFRTEEMSQLRARALTLVPPDSLEAGRLLAHEAGFGDYESAIEALSRALQIAQRENDMALERRV